MLKLAKILILLFLIMVWVIVFVFQTAIESNQNVFKTAIYFIPICLITCVLVFIYKKNFKKQIMVGNMNDYLLFNSIAIALVLLFQSLYQKPIRMLPLENEKFAHLEMVTIKPEFKMRLINSYMSLLNMTPLVLLHGARDEFNFQKKVSFTTSLILGLRDNYFKDITQIKNTCLNYEGTKNKYIACMTDFFNEVQTKYGFDSMGSTLSFAVQVSYIMKVNSILFRKLDKNDPYRKLKGTNDLILISKASINYAQDKYNAYTNSNSTCMGERVKKESKLCQVLHITNVKFILKMIESMSKVYNDPKLVMLANLNTEAMNYSDTQVSAKTFMNESRRFLILKNEIEKMVKEIDTDSFEQEVAAYENKTQLKDKYSDQQLVTQVAD